MIATRRRRTLWTLVRIVLFTMLALVIEWSHALAPVENLFYDLRTRLCQNHMPPPTDRIVHLDIDDNALDQIGRWPWDRQDLTQIIEEIRLADPKVVAMDVILPDPARPVYDSHGQKTDPDAQLAMEIRRLGRLIIPASLSFDPPTPPTSIERRLTDLLTVNPELTEEQCRGQITFSHPDAPTEEAFAEAYRKCLAQAIHQRIDSEFEIGVTNPAVIKRAVLPHSRLDAIRPGTVDRLFDEEYAHAERHKAFMRFTIAPQGGMAPVLSASDALAPLAGFSRSAEFGAFVDYLPDQTGGTVRMMPLLAEFHGRLVPHLGLVAACAMLDVDINKIRLSSDSITLPLPGGNDLVIPVSSRPTANFGKIGMLMEVPMFGEKEGWRTMYDYPRHQLPARHMSMSEIWRACQSRQRLEANEAVADDRLIRAFNSMDEDQTRSKPYAAAPLRGTEQRKLLESTISDMRDLIEGMNSVADLGPKLKVKLDRLKIYEPELREVLRQNQSLAEQLADVRKGLHEKLNGRALFIGGTGTGYLDVVPTSLHSRCPGVVVHGAVFNAIMTRKLWRVAPKSDVFIIVLCFGLITGLLVANLPPFKALFAVIVLCGGYLLFNGLYLFDYRNLVVGASGPLLAAILVWSGVTIPNFITEIKEKRRIARRFSSYVDPALVKYVVDHPESEHFAGETREMTMGFTDLAGFTTLTESMGKAVIPLLNEYIGKMIPIIRKNKGYTSRLMGDGIYFFFNAPGEDPDHAFHAVSTVLEMHEVVDRMNQELPVRGLPPLGLRAGLCSGTVIVGDAGCPQLSDYTAMGDSVNTASRLEGANKAFGSRTLVIQRTIELLNDRFLYRKIANIRVAGKTQGVDVYEPLCRIENATALQKRLAELSTAIVTAYQSACFDECLKIAGELEAEFGESKFSVLYREMAEKCQAAGTTEFSGQVIMNDK